MKSLIRFVKLTLLLILPLQAWALSSESLYVERRVQDFLSTYLESHEFMVVVNEKESPAKAKEASAANSSSLPGAPGLTIDDQRKLFYQSYFDIDGQAKGKRVRPPISLDVIVHRNVGQETRNLIRKTVPTIAGLSTEYGDTLQFKVGNLDSPARKRVDPSTENWLSTLFRNKDEFRSLFFSLILAAGALLLLNGILTMLKEREKSKQSAKDAKSPPTMMAQPAASAPPAQQSAEAAKAGAKKEQVKIGNPLPGREDLYSRDSAFFQMAEEIRDQGDKHPERIAELVNRWLQTGEVGIRNSSTLLHNFSFKIVEKIMDKMVASDLDHLRDYVNMEFDFFSPQNTRVILEARQELMKIVASASNRHRVSGFEMLAKLETHVLVELFRGDPIRNLVVACAEIPSHRIGEVLASFPTKEQSMFFTELCAVQQIESAEILKIQKHIDDKLKSLNSLMFTEDQKVTSIVQLLRNIESEDQKLDILNSIRDQSSKIFNRVRATVNLFEDVVQLPSRALKVLITGEDPVIISQAFSRQPSDYKLKLRELLSKSAQEIFDFESHSQPSPEEFSRATRRMVERFEGLLFDGVISQHDVRRGQTPGNVTQIKKAA